MTEKTLDADLEDAISRLTDELFGKTPFVADKLLEWMKALGKSDDPADYFRHPRAFPMLLLPRWFAAAEGVMPDSAFRTDLVFSTVCGYYYIRLIDNVMDKETTDEKKLLPAAGTLYLGFTSFYAKHFRADHPFWGDFEACSSTAVESTIRDALLESVSKEDFVSISSNKTCVARIPLYAVAHQHNRTGEVAPWISFVDQLAGWYQMVNDLYDWMNDSHLGIRTYFLSEGMRRKRPSQSLSSWVVDEGFDWGVALLTTQMRALERMASRLSSPELLSFLKARDEYFRQRSSEVSAGLKGLSSLVAAFDS